METANLSKEQSALYTQLENKNGNFFITGKAGTGKSTLLEYFKENTKKKIVVVAPTGVAALNIGGQTIHSLFQLPPEFLHPEKRRNFSFDPRLALLLSKIDTVVIDEISMVRADVLDAIDYRLRQMRGKKLPFGGVQMILFGDPYQLAPIVDDTGAEQYLFDNHGGPYFFNASVWKSTELEMYELTNIFRQEEEEFKMILNAFRSNEVTDEILIKLNKRASVSAPEDGEIILLATTNQIVNQVNNFHLGNLEGEDYWYEAIISGKLEKSSFPADEYLHLKVGAQIMMIKNDRERRWVNGTLGKIHSLEEDGIYVEIEGIVYPVEQETWKKIKYYYNKSNKTVDEEIISSFTQYPIKLAWAVTIHKAQGQTHKAIIVDLGSGAFTHGQTYVALSRCVSLKTLYLKQPINRQDIIVDRAVVEFMKKANIIPI